MLPVCLKILYRYVTAPHQSVSQTASPRGEAAKRLTIFAEKMKFTEFFFRQGEALTKARGRGIYGIILRCFKAARISANISSLLFLPSTTMKRSLFSRACFKKPRYTLS